MVATLIQLGDAWRLNLRSPRLADHRFYDPALRGSHEGSAVKCTQLTPSKRPREADQQQSAVTHILDGWTERRDDGRQVLGRKGRHTPLRPAVEPPEAAEGLSD